MNNKPLHPLTEKINKKQKIKAKKARLDALQWLASTFPEAFDVRIAIHPLKIGIMRDVLDQADQAAACGISKTKLRQALVVFTRSIDYLTCIKAREIRIDLFGNPTDAVSEEEANQAALKIRKHIEKYSKNQQKLMTNQIGSQKSQSKNTTLITNDQQPVCNPTTASLQAIRKNTVTVKHKVTRALDPEAIARLQAAKVALFNGQ